MKNLHIFLLVFLVSAVSFGADKTTSPIGSAYEAIGAALSTDSLADAKKHAAHLAESAEQMNQKEKNNDLSKVIDQAKKLSGAGDLAIARSAYEEISKTMEALKPMLKYEGSKYYCPMLKKNWLQSDEKVKNPYGGKDMASCGEKEGN